MTSPILNRLIATARMTRDTGLRATIDGVVLFLRDAPAKKEDILIQIDVSENRVPLTAIDALIVLGMFYVNIYHPADLYQWGISAPLEERVYPGH